MNKQRDVLVFGASGGLGIKIIQELEKRNISYLGTFNNHPAMLHKTVPESAKENSIMLNLNEEILNNFQLEGRDFKYAISTVAFTDVDQCYYKPLESLKRNVTTNFNAYMFCIKNNIPFYYVSTNDVFCNTNVPSGGWKITDEPKPRGVYARHKKLTEDILFDIAKNEHIKSPVGIFRLSLISFYKSGGTAFMTGLMDKIKNGQPIMGLLDQHVNPLYVGTAAKEIVDIMTEGIGESRIFHLAPNDYLRRYDFIVHAFKRVSALHPEFVNREFKIISSILSDLYNAGVMVDKRPTVPYLHPYPENDYTVCGEIDKAVDAYFAGSL